MLRKILMAAALVSAPMATATVELQNVTGVSSHNFANALISYEIYGGLAGPTCAVQDGVSTCDSCKEVTGLQTCNRKKIYPSLNVGITFASDKSSGVPAIFFDDIRIAVGSAADKGASVSLSLPWSEICQRLSNGSSFLSPDCVDRLGVAQRWTGTFKVGIDVNNDGILSIADGDDYSYVAIVVLDPDPSRYGDYDTIDNHEENLLAPTPKPGITQFMVDGGKGKIYLSDFMAGAGFPTTALGKISQVNVYISKNGFITRSGEVEPVAVPLEYINDEGVVGIGPFESGTDVYVRTSVSDPAGNEMFFTSDLAIMNLCGSLNPTPPFSGTAGSCPFATTTE